MLLVLSKQYHFFIPKALQAKNKEEVELFKVNEYLHFNV